MARTMKTAITIPKEDFALVETVRKETGKSRSQVLVEAFHAWIAGRRREDMEDRYEAAYRRRPEDLAETKAFLKAGAPVWGKEDW